MPVKDRTKKSALDRYRTHFKPLGKPLEDAKLPAKISTISTHQLSDLQNHYSQWREFTEDLLVEALATFTSTKMKYEYAYDVEVIKMIPKCKTKVEAETKARINDDIQKLFVDLSDAELYYELLTKKFESYNNTLATISREITSRSNTR